MTVASFLDPWDVDEDDDCWVTASAVPVDEWRNVRRRIQDVIREFGSVVPKMGGHAPTDVVCLQGNRLECWSVDEVLLLLKSSARVFDGNVSLTKFYPINATMEFRVFLKGTELRGVSSRHLDYPMPEIRHIDNDIVESIRRLLTHLTLDPTKRSFLDVYIQKTSGRCSSDMLYDVFILDWEEQGGRGFEAANRLLLPPSDWTADTEPALLLHYVVGPLHDIPGSRLLLDRLPMEFLALEDGCNTEMLERLEEELRSIGYLDGVSELAV